MTRYLVDTSIMIRMARGDRRALELVRELVARNDELGTCPIPIAEFYSGNALGERPDFDRFISALQCWDITRRTGEIAGAYRLTFRRRRITLPASDTLIAAVAFEHDAVVLTGNVRHFPMDDIKVRPFPAGP